MQLIIGLGNPGKAYANSRHNIGFLVIKTLAKTYKVSLKKDRYVFSLSGKGKIRGQNLILAMPLTFMNLSGNAVGVLLEKYKIDLDNLLVVCDDLDLEFGRIKIKDSGSSGGHRGLQSIIDAIGSQGFSRLRIGIGRPIRGNIDASEYVLTPFLKRENKKLKEIMPEACACCVSWATQGIAKSMNIFNRRSK